jgi:hypothetical protein
VLLAYRYSVDPAIAVFLNDSDAYIVREAAEAINDADIEAAQAPLAGKLASAPPADWALVVRALNSNFRLGGGPRAQALVNYALNDQATEEMRAEALKQVALWQQTAGPGPRGRHLPPHGQARRQRGGRCAHAPGGEVVGRSRCRSPCNSPRSKR